MVDLASLILNFRRCSLWLAVIALATLMAPGCVQLPLGGFGGQTRPSATGGKADNRAQQLMDRADLYARAFKRGDGQRVYSLLARSARNKTSPGAITSAIRKRYSGVNGINSYQVSEKNLRISGKRGQILVSFVRETGWTVHKKMEWVFEDGNWYILRGW